MSDKPIRVQLSRKKGWRMPPNTVNVARPTKWGNPFWHVQKFHGLALCLRLFRDMAEGFWTPSELPADWPDSYVTSTFRVRQEWVARLCGHPRERIVAELRGKNLACWCRLDQPCHADVLLELANQ